MSTRSRAKAAVSASNNPTLNVSTSPTTAHRSRRVPSNKIAVDSDRKENLQKNAYGKSHSKPEKASKAKKSYCLCHQPDDGTPMVNCSECKDWQVPLPFLSYDFLDLTPLRFHFRCVELSEREADDISQFPIHIPPP
jgi:hypothetical protein